MSYTALLGAILAGQLMLTQSPASAGTVGVTGLIQGAGSIVSVQGGPYSCSATGNQNDRDTVTCSRRSFEAVFEAWVWLAAIPATSPAGNWRFAGWSGCDVTRIENGNVQCGVHSGAFTLDERFPKAHFDDFVGPTIVNLWSTQSTLEDRRFSFGFQASEGSNFACGLDNEPLVACGSGDGRSMSEGSHTFSVRATDASGNVGATRSANVVALDTAVTSGPSGLTNSRDATLGYSTIAGLNFECSLDLGGYAPCGSGTTASKTYTGLGDGNHTFRVRALNGQWIDQLPASRTWTIDSTPPDTALSDATITGRNASFAFNGSGGPSGFECKLDGPSGADDWRSCGSPVVYNGLGDGSFTFHVRARDAAGNVDPTPDSHSWTVDLTAPETTVTTGPAQDGWALSTTAVFGYSSSEAGSTFECALDGVARQCGAPSITMSGLTQSTHRFTVAARDPRGNLDATPEKRVWTVPLSNTALNHGRGWQLRSLTAAYLGTYSMATSRGATLSKGVVGARKLALVASKGVNHGTVKVYAASTLLRTINLSAASFRTKQLIPIATFASPRTTTIRIVVASRGKQVRIEGLGVAN